MAHTDEVTPGRVREGALYKVGGRGWGGGCHRARSGPGAEIAAAATSSRLQGEGQAGELNPETERWEERPIWQELGPRPTVVPRRGGRGINTPTPSTSLLQTLARFHVV